MTEIVSWLLDDEDGKSLLSKLSDKQLSADARIRIATKKHQTIEFAYSVLCCELAITFKQMDEQSSAEQIEFLRKKLIKALSLAKTLQNLYDLYLIVPDGVDRLDKDIKFYQEVLNAIDTKVEVEEIRIKRRQSKVTKKIRETTAKTNWPRLFAVRLKRVFDAFSPIIKTVGPYQNTIYIVDTIANPIIRYLAWVFYVPRLSINLFLLLKHVLPGPWMSEDEKKLQWTTRFYAQWSRRWFELCNDAVWLVVGAVNCFILTGALAPAGVYLTVALYSFDVCLSLIRFAVDMYRYSRLLKECDDKIDEILQCISLDSEQKDQLASVVSFRNHLKARIAHEKKQLLLSVATACSLLGAMLFAMPLLAVNPWIPLVGACLVVAICIVSFALGKYLQSQSPTKSLDIFSKEDKQKQVISKLSANNNCFFSAGEKELGKRNSGSIKKRVNRTGSVQGEPEKRVEKKHRVDETLRQSALA